MELVIVFDSRDNQVESIMCLEWECSTSGMQPLNILLFVRILNWLDSQNGQLLNVLCTTTVDLSIERLSKSLQKSCQLDE